MTNYTELVERLDEEALNLGSRSWSRDCGGPDCGIAASLASEASTAISTLERENRELRELLGEARIYVEDCFGDLDVKLRARIDATLKGSEV